MQHAARPRRICDGAKSKQAAATKRSSGAEITGRGIDFLKFKCRAPKSHSTEPESAVGGISPRFSSSKMECMVDTIASVVGWGLCLGIGAPLVLLGFLHFAFPKAAWSVYRGWGRSWAADPQEIAPEYKSSVAMRVVGIACGLGGLAICVTPTLMGL